LIFVSSVTIAASCFVGAAAFLMEAHAVSIHRLSQIQIGTSEAKVESILGPPSLIMQSPYDNSWQYTGATWCNVTISFDANGLVDEVVQRHTPQASHIIPNGVS
jgi:uncharacterized lipoprotein